MLPPLGLHMADRSYVLAALNTSLSNQVILLFIEKTHCRTVDADVQTHWIKHTAGNKQHVS